MKNIPENFYIAGIDGGGTKTECAIVDQDGECIGVGVGGPSRVSYTGLELALESIRTAIESAKAEKQLEDALVVGCTHMLAGNAEVSSLVTGLLGGQIRDYTEGEAALACVGVFERFGISHIAGTGTSTWGYGRDGKETRVGGWGMLLGDEGGAYDIALRGLRAAVRGLDGRGPQTALLDLALGHFDLSSDRASLVGFATTRANRHVVASFASCVTAAARDGDAVAQEIAHYTAEENANSIIALARQIFESEDSFVVALHGGVMKDEWISGVVTVLVKHEFPNADVRRPVHSPGLGLALLALNDIKRELNSESENG